MTPIKADDYKDLKLQLDGYVKPGQGFHRNVLLETMYASLPRDAQAKVQVYNAEIAPGGYTNWHCHNGATFFIAVVTVRAGVLGAGHLVADYGAASRADQGAVALVAMSSDDIAEDGAADRAEQSARNLVRMLFSFAGGLGGSEPRSRRKGGSGEGGDQDHLAHGALHQFRTFRFRRWWRG